MPTEHSPASQSGKYPWTERLRRYIGEDPARFLDQPILDNSAGQSPLLLARARIQGIDSWDVLTAWAAVERHPATRGPREKVMFWLQERKRDLEEIGDRDERLQDAPRLDPEPTESCLVFLDEDGNERTRNSFTSSVSRSSEFVATDGGESA